MIRVHSRKVQEVRRLAVQTHMHKVLLRRRRDVLGRSLHGRLGTAGLLTSGVAAGFLAGLLLSPLRFLHGSGRVWRPYDCCHGLTRHFVPSGRKNKRVEYLRASLWRALKFLAFEPLIERMRWQV